MIGEQRHPQLPKIVQAMRRAGLPREPHSPQAASKPMRVPMIVMTTKSSTSVKPGMWRSRRDMGGRHGIGTTPLH